MKKLLMLAVCGLTVTSAMAIGKAVVTFPKGDKTGKVVVSHATIENLVTARRQSDLKIVYDTINVKKRKATFNLDIQSPSRFSIELAPKVQADFYAAPDENIVVDIISVNPLNYSVSGTELMKDMTSLAAITSPIEAQYYALASTGSVTEEQLLPIMEAYDQAIKDFVKNNPDSPATPYAILDLEGEDFLNAYRNLTPEARKSIMMPFAEQNVSQVEQQLEIERKRQAMMSGEALAPGFTLPDLEGKEVSLSEFRGKWVILDFWGSWCSWCIKGFPKLKEAYRQYDGKLEVIGIDCREPEEAWKAGVKKYALPWVNLYNGDSTELLETYGVQGFPTKAIINPEGKLVDVTVGEDPTFYDKLSKFINQ